MIFSEAIEFSKKFHVCHPKIFNGFMDSGLCHNKTDSYVVLADYYLAQELCYFELTEYVRDHNLRIDHYKDYVMISTSS
jgi:hypothetical protein